MKIDLLANDGSPLGVVPQDIYGRGVGGAELAMLSLVETFAARGHEVRVYNDPIPEGVHAGVTFLPRTAYQNRLPRDVLIIFRSPNPLVRFPDLERQRVIWWSTDQYTVGSFAALAKEVQFCIAISPFHRDHLITTYGIEPTKIGVLDLGVRLQDYQTPVERVKNRLIFCSVPDRGLTILHACWPLLLKVVPDASLVITSDYRLWGLATPKNHQHRLAWAGLRNVQFLGRVPRLALVAEQQRADLLAYPCTYDELFCCLPATRVLTPDGVMPVGRLRVGQLVETPSGFAPISAVHVWLGARRSVLVRSMGSNQPLRLTREHKVLAVRRAKASCQPLSERVRKRKQFGGECRPEWIQAGNLEVGDLLVAGFDRTELPPEPVRIVEHVTNAFLDANGRLMQRYRHVGGVAIREARAMPTIRIDETFMRLAGYYISDGSTSRGTVQITIGQHEMEKWGGDVLKCLEACFGLPARTTTRHAVNIYICSTVIARLMEALFGKGARAKHIPDRMMTAPVTLQEQLIVGLIRGDGSVGPDTVRFSTSSEVLARQMVVLLARLDIAGSLRKTKRRGWTVVVSGEASDRLAMLCVDRPRRARGRRPAEHIWLHDGMLHHRITQIETSRHLGAVYDISLSHPHAFNADGRTIHNCLAVAECCVAGALPVTTTFGALPTTADAGIMLSGVPTDPRWVSNYVGRLASLLTDERAYLEQKRTAMMLQSAVRFDWNRIAERWEYLFEHGKLEG